MGRCSCSGFECEYVCNRIKVISICINVEKRERTKKCQNAYLGRLNLGEFHLIIIIISTGIDVFPPVLVIGVAGEGELDVVPREDGVGEGGGGRPAGDEEEEERVEGPDDDEGVRGPPPRGQRGRVVVPS